MPTLLHDDCVACLAKNETESAVDATLTLLIMLNHDTTLEVVMHNLCFYHRRIVQDCVRKARELGV